MHPYIFSRSIKTRLTSRARERLMFFHLFLFFIPSSIASPFHKPGTRKLPFRPAAALRRTRVCVRIRRVKQPSIKRRDITGIVKRQVYRNLLVFFKHYHSRRFRAPSRTIARFALMTKNRILTNGIPLLFSSFTKPLLFTILPNHPLYEKATKIRFWLGLNRWFLANLTVMRLSDYATRMKSGTARYPATSKVEIYVPLMQFSLWSLPGKKRVVRQNRVKHPLAPSQLPQRRAERAWRARCVWCTLRLFFVPPAL